MKFLYMILMFCILSSCKSQNTSSDDSEGEKHTMEIKDSTFLGQKYLIRDHNHSVIEEGYLVKQVKEGTVRIYDHDTLKDVFVYSAGKTLFKVDAADYVFKQTQINKFMSIELPENWINSKDQTVFNSVKNNCIKDEFCPNISIVEEKNIKDVDFLTYIKYSINQLEKNVQHFKPVAIGKINIGKEEAFQITYMFAVNGKNIGGCTTWIKFDDMIIAITGLSSNDENGGMLKFLGLFQEISATFIRS